ATGDLTGHWLILADLEGTGSALAKRLEQSGATTTILTPNDFAVLDPQAYISVLNQVTELGKRSLRGIVHLWGLLEKEISLEASHWGYASALFLAQACLKTASPPRLWFITQGAQAVPENTKDMVHPAQSALWGFARTLALEHGDLRPVILDLEMGAQTPEATIFAELANDDGENQVAWRVGKRYVARLARHQSEADALILPDKPFELIASQQGLLDLISVRLKTTRPPGLREVEIAVHAAGLNFRDVLNALGMYPGQAGKLGNECVGVVTAIGEDVSNVKVGDAVMALASGTFAPTVVAQSEFVFPIPANLSFIESATIPITFLTAYYGLHHLAKIRSGDRILIHAAAGGVGLAAVQLAQRAGAIIYATAGSPEKRAFLRSLGVQYIMNSRSLDFAEEIMTATNGEGVNIVLNALAGDFIQKSFSVLADNGRFLEMGKRDIWTHEQVTAFNRTLAYYPYDLADVTGGMPHLIGEMFSDLKAEFEAGMLSPLPQTTFPMSRAREAFRFMSRAHHTGKIVIVPEQLPTLPANATYLITGGLGGLGLALAQKLAERGARHLVLISRSEPSTAALTQSEKLRAEGVNVVVAKADVAVMAEMKQVLDQIDSGMPPLRGIIHAAGVVADGTLSNQTWAQFESVMRPKMLGAMHQDTLTRHQPLDFFVLFSAGASLLGSRGQVNYSAANAFLDGFAHYRRAHGLPALSINWGGWSQVGMAARLNPEINRRRELQGIRMVSPEEGLHIFENLVNQNLPQIGVIPIEWATFARQLEDRAAYSILADLIQSEQPRQETSTQVVTPRIRQQLDALPLREKLQALQTHVKEHLIAVLALKPNHRLDMRQGFAEMGMDSLMAVELSRRLQRSLDCVLPTTLAFEYPTVEALTNYLATEILGIIVADANRKPTKGVEKQSVMDEVDEVPEDQLEDALLKELKDAGY
ncbi:MAG: SDR family NAD(P)-dependent oxidoreductase, partial [Anaerolineales bacterium]